MTAEIIQFIPRPNPERLTPVALITQQQDADGHIWDVIAPTDCGNIGHPWPGEDRA